MLVASHVAIFCLGFVAAIVRTQRSKKARGVLKNFIAQLRYVIEQLTSASPRCSGDGYVLENSNRQYDSTDVSNRTHLLTKEDIETHFDMSCWQRLAYEDFKATLLAKGSDAPTFPCVYATMGYRSNDHRYIFLDSDDLSSPHNLRLIAPALKEYLTISKQLGPNTSLVIIGGPSPSLESVEHYNASFWNMLRGLRTLDSQPWPADIPQDTGSEKWTFCFDGQPLFPVMLTPAHRHRWSRHMSVPVAAMQPKWVLENLLGTPEKRDAATTKVRQLLAGYDQVDVSPDLTSYGQPGTSEVRQLCLLDENETAQCPYKDFDR